MQAAIRTVAQWLDRMVRTLPISGSIAALASWNSMKLPEKINSGRRRVGILQAGQRPLRRLLGLAAMGALRIDLAGADVGAARSGPAPAAAR